MNQGEKLIAGFPGMGKHHPQGPFDFPFTPGDLRVEVKFRNANFFFNNGQVDGETTEQFIWTKIAARQFDWLILIGVDLGGVPHYWISPDRVVRSRYPRIMTPSDGGKITCILNPFRPLRPRAQVINAHKLTYEELYADCQNGRLGYTVIRRS